MDVTKMASLSPAVAHASGGAMVRGTVSGLGSDGSVRVVFPNRETALCDCLDPHQAASALEAGMVVLVAILQDGTSPVILGRIGPYAPARAQPTLILEATESLTLKCGEASVELRADGRAMIKGEDVLLRAKGTQRIRAGNVAIN